MSFGLGLGLKLRSSGRGVPPTPAAPVNTVLPAISGSAVEGQTLSSTTGTWTGYPAPTFAYQWKRAGSNITGATSATYLLVLADVGSTITVTVTATNASGSASATSAATATVTAAPAATARTLEDGSARNLEDGTPRYLEAA